jgi:D-sedoheptulose 7-phosphate isomerase
MEPTSDSVFTRTSMRMKQTGSAIDTAGVTPESWLITNVVDATTTVLRALCADDLAAAARLVERGLREGRRILLLGNGGSCATASHMATDLLLIAREAGLRASITALNDSASVLSAMANDYGFAESGAALIETHASAGDILVIFSCSARSSNLLSAAHAAGRLGVVTLLVGSRLAPPDFPAQQAIVVGSEHYSVIEVAHLAVMHLLTDLVRQHLGVESPRCSPRLLGVNPSAGD